MNGRYHVLTILALAVLGLGPLAAEAAQVTGLTPAPSPATTGSAVTITVTGTSGKCGKLELDFGDGSKTTLRDITFPKGTPHTYTTAKTYTLKARGQSGDCSGQKSASLTVNPPPPAPRAAPRATQSIMSVRELCKITDCTPKITSVFLFSVIKPGGGVIVFGEAFGGPRYPGKLLLKGLRRWDGAPVGDLALEDLSWDDTVVGGYIPWVTGVRDQDATLQVVTKAGVSNDQKVRFTAARAADQVKYGGVLSAVCSDAGGENLCGFGSILSIIGHHRGTYTSGAEGTDVYEGLLKNGWVFKTYDWLDRAGVDRGFEGFRPDSPNLYATVKWFYDAGLFSGMHYKLNIYIEGPADVPHR